MASDPEAPTRDAPPAPLPAADERTVAAEPPPDVLERGAVVDRYTILERVGQGGMGEVYAAYDGKLDRKVALKMLLSRGAEYEARLSREAQGMARLSHPNVVAVFDTGVVSGRLFLAMEFVAGTTLRVWQRSASRTLPELLRVYLEAGQGLAAAHAAGLVHRDFKPDNVLVSSDGVVKVTDFGLVRAADERAGASKEALANLAKKLSSVRPAPMTSSQTATSATDETTQLALSADMSVSSSSERSKPASLETPMTEVGTLLGTVGYMAPEQYLSEPVNARTDQFAFCVALYDALYGQKPFAGKGVVELADAAVAGRIREPPKGTHVPARIHRVLLRGLSPENERRYPSMQDLLDDLVRDPAQQRRRLMVGTLSLLVIVALVAFVQRFTAARQGRLCSGAETLTREVWGDEVKQRLERSLLATELPFASDTWRRTREQLDQYMGAWGVMHEQTCRATRVDGHQSDALMAMRMACLEVRRTQVRALTHMLDEADRQTVEKAVEAARNLPAIADCADVTSLTTVKALPADLLQRATIAALGREVVELRVRDDAGQFKDPITRAPALVERARATGYEPLIADALLVLGSLQAHLGMKPEAAGTLRETVYAAVSGRTDDVLVRALIALVAVLGDQRKFDEAHAMSRLASAASTRLTDPEVYGADLHSANAWVLFRESRFDESAAESHKAMAAAEKAPDANPVRLARLLTRAGVALGDAGHYAEAYEFYDRADATFVRVLGPDHPVRASNAVNQSATLIDEGRWAEGVATTAAALSLAERVLPPESGTLANLYSNRAGSLFGAGRSADAAVAAQQSIDIGRVAFGPTSVTVAGYTINLGWALWALGRYDEAVTAFDGVLSVIEPTLPKDHEWLAEARSGRGDANVGRHMSRVAIPDLEQALKSYAAIPRKTIWASLSIARAQAALARALWESGVRAPRVAELTASSQATFESLHDDAHAHEVGAWVSGHPIAGSKP